MTNTSINVQDLRRRIAVRSKAEPGHRFWGLYCHVWKHNVLAEAYRLARKNGGAHGSDGVSFTDIEQQGGAKALIETLSQELKEGIYVPLKARVVQIPKSDGSTRTLKIPAVRDRVVQGAIKIVTEPIFEMDFQPGSFGYRPKRSAHDALQRVRMGLNKCLLKAFDLDLKSFFDTVRHDKLLSKLAKRIDDDQMLRLCKLVLKSGGKRGLPQGSIVGPLWANVFLTELDEMLEKAQLATQNQHHESIRYVRFADDLVILVSNSKHAKQNQWLAKVKLRVEQEIAALDLEINQGKTNVVELDRGDKLNFLGYTFQMFGLDKNFAQRRIIARPQKAKRTAFLRSIKTLIKRNRFKPTHEVTAMINPRLQGWVNYFSWGHPQRDIAFVKWQVEVKVRKLATRQRRRKRGGKGWAAWSPEEVHDILGLKRVNRSAKYRIELPARAVT